MSLIICRFGFHQWMLEGYYNGYRHRVFGCQSCPAQLIEKETRPGLWLVVAKLPNPEVFTHD